VKKYVLFLAVLFFSFSLLGTKKVGERNHNIYIVPGLGGFSKAGLPEYVKRIFGLQEASTIPVPNPRVCIDFGQDFCRRKLERSFLSSGLIYGLCLGTSTILNFLALHKDDDRVKGVFLESGYASVNDTVRHTVETRMGVPHLPLSYYWLPYCFNPFFYRPFGAQPIKSALKVKTDVPLVIMHSRQDPSVPYEHAQILYYALKHAGNKNVYLLPSDVPRHVRTRPDNDRALRTILQHHALVPMPLRARLFSFVTCKIFSKRALRCYQPNPEQFREAFERLYEKEKTHEKIGDTVKQAVITTLCGLFSRLVSS
jgi:hypothetical protein